MLLQTSRQLRIGAKLWRDSVSTYSDGCLQMSHYRAPVRERPIDRPQSLPTWCEKEVSVGTGSHVDWAMCQTRGQRPTMEDYGTCSLDVNGFKDLCHFAVFDGHGGDTAASLGSKTLSSICSSYLDKDSYLNSNNLSKALYNGIFHMDQALLKMDQSFANGTNISGTTCVTAFVTPDNFVIANCGDSRAIVCSGSDNSVAFVSKIHSPDDANEQARIKRAGGYVEFGRVCGILNISRSLGNFRLKDRRDLPLVAQKVTAESDLAVVKRSHKKDFLVLASDGVFEVMDEKECVHLISKHMKEGLTLSEIVERMIEYCVLSEDNISICVVAGK
eukprot:m.128866 g.128866  ORF g.128866 m.128866 type:complete len:331 (+) comp14567_c0_seq1:304-1296(+)